MDDITSEILFLSNFVFLKGKKESKVQGSAPMMKAILFLCILVCTASAQLTIKRTYSGVQRSELVHQDHPWVRDL